MNKGKTAILVVLTLLFAGLFVYRQTVMPLYLENTNFTDVGWAAGKLGTQKDVYDVIVAGEQPDGIASAITAARAGAKTLLLVEGKQLFTADGKAGRRTLGIEPVNGKTPGRLLNELDSRLGKQFTARKYSSVLSKLVKAEKNLDVVYEAGITGVLLDKNNITGLKVFVNSEIESYRGRRVIDCTIDGKVLELCSIPPINVEEDRSGSISRFKGDYLFTEEDIATGTVFHDSIATAFEKLPDENNMNGDIAAYRGGVYNIPLRSMLPSELENLVMTGPKASLDSFTAASASKTWIMVVSGEAAGNAAVYSLFMNITPRRLTTGHMENMKNLQKILRREGILSR